MTMRTRTLAIFTSLLFASAARAQTEVHGPRLEPVGTEPVEPLVAGPSCARTIVDQANAGACLEASSVPTAGSLFPYPGQNNDFSGSNFVGGGGFNLATGNFATVAGGFGNSVTNLSATISGGADNTASGDSAAVGGGYLNDAAGDYTSVSGGKENSSRGRYSSIGGGIRNLAVGSWSVVGGGYWNSASGPFGGAGGGAAVVGGGSFNTAAGTEAVVAGGTRNFAGGRHATISGGIGNVAAGEGATVSGGGGYNGPDVPYYGNRALADWSTIAGGGANSAFGRYGTVSGGYANQANGSYGTVVGGRRNSADGSYSVVGGRSSRASADFTLAAGSFATAAHDGAFVWGDSQAGVQKSSSVADEFTVYASGGARFFTNTTATTGVLLAAGGGSWSSVSDRDAKENLVPVDGRAVLDELVSIPISSWNYRAQADRVRHIGPMAQDFHAAFGLGVSERLIDTVDADGVALAAIQGLDQKLEERSARLTSALERVDELESLVASLASRIVELERGERR